VAAKSEKTPSARGLQASEGGAKVAAKSEKTPSAGGLLADGLCEGTRWIAEGTTEALSAQGGVRDEVGSGIHLKSGVVLGDGERR
jgi:hypothetical protein